MVKQSCNLEQVPNSKLQPGGSINNASLHNMVYTT